MTIFRLSRRTRRQLIQIGGMAGATALLLAISWPGIQQNMRSATLVRDRASEQNAQLELRKLEEERLQAQSDIADQRLQTLCTDFAVSKADPSRMTSVTEGLAVVDPVSLRPIADGSIICDVQGRTAIVRNGVLTDVAVSRSPQRLQLVQAALKAKGLRVAPGNPDVRPGAAQQQEEAR